MREPLCTMIHSLGEAASQSMSCSGMLERMQCLVHELDA